MGPAQLRGGAPPLSGGIDGIILATLYEQFKKMSLADLARHFNGEGFGVLVDVKSYFLDEAKQVPKLIYKCL